MMNKKTIAVFIISFAFLGFAGGAFAHGVATTSTDATSTSGTTSPAIAVADTLPSAGLTPLSPFYFLDRAADWARVNFFFFNPMKRAEVAAEVANERLAELKEVSEKDPQKTDVIEGLENDVVNRIDKAHGELEKLSAKNKKAGPLLKKMENLSLNSQRVMENMLLRNAPEKIKERTERSLKNIYKFAKKRQAVLMDQKEKGLISAAEAEKLVNERMERMKNQIERRSERIDKIENPVLKEKLKGIMSEKLNMLEDTVFSTESMGEGTTTGKRVGAIRRRAIKSILQARKRMMLRSATTTEETLKDMYEGKIDFKERSGDLIEKARETIQDVEEKIGEMGSTTPKINAIPVVVHSAQILLVTANRRLTEAKKAFEAEKYRVAFGLAMSAARTSRVAERIMERVSEKFDNTKGEAEKGNIRDVEDGGKMIDRIKKDKEGKVEKEMGDRRGQFERRSEGEREILKNKMKERREKFEKQSENERDGFLKRKMKERGE